MHSNSFEELETLISDCGYVRSIDVWRRYLRKQGDVCCPAMWPVKVYKTSPCILLKNRKRKERDPMKTLKERNPSKILNESNLLKQALKQLLKQLLNSWRISGSFHSDALPITVLEANVRVHIVMPRAGIRSVRTGSDHWTDTEPEVIRSTTEPSFLTSVRSFKAVRTAIIGTEQRSESTDVESGFLYARTEPIRKMVPSTEPNQLSTVKFQM